MDVAVVRELMQQLTALGRGERDKHVADAATMLGISKVTLYRHLKKQGWTSGRKARADKGKAALSDEELQAIAAMQRATQRKNGKDMMSAGDAQAIAAANGLLERELHPATVNRLLRRKGLSVKQMRRDTPHINLATSHPNQMWQIDPSYCVLYYLKDSKGLAVMDEAKFYKNKPQNFAKIAHERVLRYVAVDHCSGAFYCRYYNVSGENAETMFEFLMAAMGTKDKEHNPFEGVPEMLVWDKGSANQSALIINCLNGLGVKHYAHVKGNSRAKGSVEKHNDIIERKFESRLAFMQVSSIEELNAACEAWQRHYQANVLHSRHGMTRFAAWRKIKPEQLIARPPIEICRVLLTSKPQQRKVAGNYQISFAVAGYGSQQYRVAEVDDVRIGETVEVAVNPYAAPSIWVSHPDRFGEMKRYEIAPLAKNEWGFTEDAVAVTGHFEQAPLDVISRNRQDLDEMAWGTRDAQQIDKLRNSKSAPAFGGALNPLADVQVVKASKVRHLPKQGKPLAVEATAPQQIDVNPLFVPAAAAPREELPRPIIDLLRWAATQTTMSAELNAELRETYPDGLPESAWQSALDAALKTLTRAKLKVIA